jgi:cytochrome b561
MFRNTDSTYGSVAKWLHWLIALWVLTAYFLIYYLKWALTGDEQMRGLFIGYHKAVGFSILVLATIRVYWRVTNPAPKHLDDMPAWQTRASRASHFLLYFFLLAMPISGYVGNGIGVNYGIFQVMAFKDTSFAIWIIDTLGITYEQLEVPFDTFHYRIAGPFVLWVLVLIHASAAIYHHTVRKDNVLRRMLPRKR